MVQIAADAFGIEPRMIHISETATDKVTHTRELTTLVPDKVLWLHPKVEYSPQRSLNTLIGSEHFRYCCFIVLRHQRCCCSEGLHGVE